LLENFSFYPQESVCCKLECHTDLLKLTLYNFKVSNLLLFFAALPDYKFGRFSAIEFQIRFQAGFSFSQTVAMANHDPHLFLDRHPVIL